MNNRFADLRGNALREVSNIPRLNKLKYNNINSVRNPPIMIKPEITSVQPPSCFSSRSSSNFNLNNDIDLVNYNSQSQILSPTDSDNTKVDSYMDIIDMFYSREKEIYTPITSNSQINIKMVTGYVTNYLDLQPDINEKKRLILLNWLIEVHYRFKLHPETLFLAVNIVDRYLSKNRISIDHLQLIGIVSLLLAAKYEEIYPPNLKDCLNIVANSYSKNSFIRTERLIASSLSYKFTVPTPYPFLLHIFQVLEDHSATLNFKLDSVLKNASLMYLEYATQSYKHLTYYPSELAHSSFLLGTLLLTTNNIIQTTQPLALWPTILTKVTKTPALDFIRCAEEILDFVHQISTTKYQTIRVKYSKPDYNEVGKLISPVKIIL